MENQNVGTSQTGVTPPPTGDGGNPAPAMEYSDLAATRAQRPASVPGAGAQADSGQSVPDGQVQEPQRSAYIPRERFDEVNTRRIAAEAQLQQLQQMTQQQRQNAALANQYQGQPQPQTQQALDFLGSISSKEEQEKWRQKIINQPVTGIAELIQHALRTEGTALLQQAMGNIQNTLTPLQQFYQQQQVNAVHQYANQRRSDPNSGWGAVEPVFNQLVDRARQMGHPMNANTLQVVESVARMQAGVPAWSNSQAPSVPFTERPSGVQAAQPQQAPVLSAEQQKVARMLGVDDATYARNLNAIRGMQ